MATRQRPDLATLKTEEVEGAHYRTRQQFKTGIFSYLEGFYNAKHRHCSLRVLSPNDLQDTLRSSCLTTTPERRVKISALCNSTSSVFVWLNKGISANQVGRGACLRHPPRGTAR